MKKYADEETLARETGKQYHIPKDGEKVKASDYLNFYMEGSGWILAENTNKVGVIIAPYNTFLTLRSNL